MNKKNKTQKALKDSVTSKDNTEAKTGLRKKPAIAQTNGIKRAITLQKA